MTPIQTKYVVYTDGACKGNPGPGGWGCVFVDDLDNFTFFNGGERNTTNNRMELKAVIEALKRIDDETIPYASIHIHSDSQYVIKGASEWIRGWKARGWMTSDKMPVKNMDLWQELDRRLNEFAAVEWTWVRGHSGNRWNEKADKLANLGIRKGQ